MTAVSRDLIVSAVARALGEEQGMCLRAHQVVGGRVADLLGFPAQLTAELPHDRPRGPLRQVGPGRWTTGPPPAPPDPAPSSPRSEPLIRGLWIDDTPGRATQTDYLDRLRALELDEIAVMVESSGGGWDVSWPLRRLTELRAATPSMRRIVTIWPEPTARYMAGLEQSLGPICDALGSDVVELDLEGHWKRGRVQGYPSLAKAAEALMDVVDDVTGSVEVTTFPAHLEAMDRGSVRGEDRLLLQTYSVAEARGVPRDYDGRYGPERRPYEDVLLARKRGEPGVEVCAGLAAWAQAGWPGEPDEAMAVALDSALRAGVRRVRWWSSKHVIGARANRYAARAIAASIGAAVQLG